MFAESRPAKDRDDLRPIAANRWFEMLGHRQSKSSERRVVSVLSIFEQERETAGAVRRVRFPRSAESSVAMATSRQPPFKVE